jgi:hypothetical protein
MDGEAAVNVFDIAVRGGTLPAKMEELVPLSFIGSAAVKFYQAKVKLFDQLGISEAQRKATLADGQDAGEMLLDIEAKIGELVGEPQPLSSRKDKATGRMVETLPDGIEPRRAYNSRAIHRNPAAVAAVKADARKNEDIPTKTAVLNKIKLDNYKKKHPAHVKEKPDINAVTTSVANAIGDVYIKLTKMWPEREYMSDLNVSSIVDTLVSLMELCEDELTERGITITWR